MNKEKEIKIAAALKYSPEKDLAPSIVASGKGDVAEKILKEAKESNVPVYEDKELACVLSSMRIGDEIPPDLYNVVAKILVFVSDLDKSYGV